MLDQSAIENTVANYFSAIRASDEDAWIATFADDAVSYDPVGAPPHEGEDALREFFQGINAAFAEIGLHEQDVFVAGDSAAVKWTGHGVGHNGTEVEFAGIDVFEINDRGQIQTLRAYWNPGAVMEKIGG